jgi:hypothetical protein
MPKKTHTVDEVGKALNRAADGILEAVEAGDEGLRDAVNLLVNAASYYLEHPRASLDEAIAVCYTVEAGEDGPLEWAACA